MANLTLLAVLMGTMDPGNGNVVPGSEVSTLQSKWGNIVWVHRYRTLLEAGFLCREQELLRSCYRIRPSRGLYLLAGSYHRSRGIQKGGHT